MSVASSSYPQFTIPTIALASLVTSTTYTIFSFTAPEGVYFVSGAIRSTNSLGSWTGWTITCPNLASALYDEEISNFNLGALGPDAMSNANIPISFIYKSDGINPLVLTFSTQFFSGIQDLIPKNIRFNRLF